MATLKLWQDTVKRLGNRSAFKAKDLYTAEQAAYKAFEATVEEMKRTGHGVLPHDGNNLKTVITGAISLLAYGDKKGFTKEIENMRTKASYDAVHYAPVSQALTVAQGHLKNAALLEAGAGKHQSHTARVR